MTKYESMMTCIIVSTLIICLTILSIKGCEESEKTARECIAKGMNMLPNGKCIK